MTTVVISTRGRAETEALTRALINLGAAGLRTHAPTPHSPSSGYPTTPANDAKPHDSADTAPSSWNAEQQPTPETNAGTSGEAATTPAVDHKESAKESPIFRIGIFGTGRHAEPSIKAINVGKRLPSTRVEWLWDRFWAWMATPELERLWDRFWAWMATPAAGNLALWVGAVGTTGAILLGLHLLRRDSAAKVADQVSVWRSWQLRPSQDDPPTADVFAQLHIANHSLGLIILPRVYTWIASDGEVGQEFALEDLPPYGAEVIEVPVADPRVKLCSVVSFKDRRGKTWLKDMHTQKVIHGRKVRRRIVAIRRAKLKWLAQQYRPPAAMLADDAADQAMSAAPEYLGLSSH